MADPIQYGRYKLIKRLAAGGMAQVWLARQSGMEGFEKLLVIKQVLPHLAGTQEFTAMFLDEARLAARLNHTNVVQVFDLGREPDPNGEDTLYIAMEFIHGDDLRRLDRASRKARNPVPIPLVSRIIADAAAGLHYAHTLTTDDGRPLGIVHRDVSPQNILVTFDGGVKIVDFGIAKAADRVVKTQSGVLKGKYAYMSPEQAAGRELDRRTDIFALGIILHELVTGRRLFKRASEILTLHAVVRCEVESPSSLNPIIPKGLDPIILKALEKHVDDRYQSAEELQLDLEDFIMSEGQPASSAHLGAYMRDIFAERLKIEAEEGGPVAYLAKRTSTASKAVRERSETGPLPGDSRVDGEIISSDDPDLLADESAHSASRFVQLMRKRRSLVMAGLGTVGGAAIVVAALALFGGNETGGPPTAHVAGLGTGRPATPAPDDPGATSTPAAPPPVGSIVEPVAEPAAEPVVEPALNVEKPTTGTLRIALTPAGSTASVKKAGKWRRIKRSTQLPPGKHKVRIFLPDGATLQETVTVRVGQSSVLKRSYRLGTLQVVLLPFGSGGEVKIRGKLVGTVPGAAIFLYEGTHRVTVISDDGKKTSTRKVTIEPGKRAKLTVTL